ncbi:hypothetical protein O6H91_18G080000 [Diphasiastrum complanatum]|nr:hypothetical protein O6H91_18G080000 [Diphasiastrum complanatum]
MESNGPQPLEIDLPVEQTNRSVSVRMPKWSMHESLMLIAAKKSQEEDKLLSSRSKLVSADMKWEAVSAFCGSHGVLRSRVQCKKRWNLLHCEYKRICDYNKKNGAESYWMMPSNRRKELDLPVNFDSSIFNAMDAFYKNKAGGVPAVRMDAAQAPSSPERRSESGIRGAANVEPPHETPSSPNSGEADHQAPFTSAECRKKRRESVGAEELTPAVQLALALENNARAMQNLIAKSIHVQRDQFTKALSAQAEAHKEQLEIQKLRMEARKYEAKLDRRQRKQQTDMVVNVLGKLADAVSKLADKL